ncbi:NUDIX hydrolase N-terminal domain-containing protein [Maribacter sp. R77961]|uniref:NUDIX hydrolase n=1 Tax=Maribacter sp. R77961 TaxID=3093871 RepID=UPI0037C853DC
MKVEEQLTLIKRLKSLAETGLVYVEDDYARERYEELRKISLQLMGAITSQPVKLLNDFFLREKDYPTVKVDVRGFVLNDKNQILMAKESIDEKWTIPGGWADIGDTPTEAVIKEIREETGLDAEVVRLLAIYDKRCHNHPPEPFYIYKLMFLCTITGGNLQHGFDMKGADFFSLNDLPQLSEPRILESQLKHLFQLANSDNQSVHID